MKYKILEIGEGERTRFVTLENLETGSIERCFDDSAVVSDKNFHFMKPGQEYDCRIALSGDPVNEPDQWSKEIVLKQAGIQLGFYKIAEVSVGDDTYYIPDRDAEDLSIGEMFLYSSSRKDLIQVGDMINGGYLIER